MFIKMSFDYPKRCWFFHSWWWLFKHYGDKGLVTYKHCLDCGSRRVEVKGEVSKELIDVEWGCGSSKGLKFF